MSDVVGGAVEAPLGKVVGLAIGPRTVNVFRVTSSTTRLDSLLGVHDGMVGAAAGVDRVSNWCVRSRHDEMVTKVTDDLIEISFTTSNWSKVTRAISVVSVVICCGSLYFRCNRRW